MNTKIFEASVKLIVFLLFLVLLASTAYYCFVNLVYGWIAKPPARQLSHVAIASSISLLVVLLLKFTAGNIEFEILALKFKGASGPVVLWILCFLATILGIYVLSPGATG